VNEKDPFQVNDDEDEDEDEDDEEVGEDIDVLLTDAVEQEIRISATLDGIDVASGFQQLFSVVKRKNVFIKDADEAL
jgi:hypothetical protein